MKTIIALAVALFLGSKVSATAQYPDKIIYHGRTYNLHTNPLEAYFGKYPDKRPKGGLMSTALWRGYIATFEIRDNQLFLRDIEVEYRDTLSKKEYDLQWKSVLSEVFLGGDPVKIDWFTGLLVMPYGKLINYVHMGYGSTYKNYILLEINEGSLQEAERFSYNEYERFKERQFAAFKAICSIQTDRSIQKAQSRAFERRQVG